MGSSAYKFVPEALLVDVPDLDAEHEEIFDLLASLKAECLDGGPLTPAVAEKIICKLRQHFETEECLAMEAGINFSTYSRKHAELLETISDLLGVALDGKGNIFCLLRYLEYWCERHILDEDRLLSDCLKARTLGDSTLACDQLRSGNLSHSRIHPV